MGEPHNHHVISRLILRRFSQDGNRIVVVRRPPAVGDPWRAYSRVALRRTAMVRDFNVVRLPNHQAVTTLEDAVARHVEDPAARGLSIIVEAAPGPLTLPGGLRTAICQLAGLLHANSAAGRERLGRVVDDLVPKVRGGAPITAVETVAGAAAFDSNDPSEVAAWVEVFAFMRDGATGAARKNLERLTILLGRHMATSLSKRQLIVYRLNEPPYLLLPDIPVLGKAPGEGDIPDRGSFVLFPFDHRHLLVFDADAMRDEVRGGDDPRLNALLRSYFPTAPTALVSAREWATTIAWTSMGAESYALRVEDVAAAARLVEPGARVLLKTVPSMPGRGIELT